MAAVVKTDRQSTTRKARVEETRQRLIASALEHFGRSHYDQVSVSEIAETAGVAHGLLFHHFQNKRGIYLEAIRDAASNLDMVGKVVEGLPIDQQLRRLMQFHLDYLAQHRGMALRLILGGRGADPEAWEIFEAGRWRIIEWFCVELDLDPQSHALRMMLRASIGAIDEAAAYWLANEESFDLATMTDVLVGLAAKGLQAAIQLEPSLDPANALLRLTEQAR